jgi:hypothetical protein
MPKWRKTTWAIAIWTAIIAFGMLMAVVVMITKPQEEWGGIDMMLLLGPVNWVVVMLVLGPIWLLSRPKRGARPKHDMRTTSSRRCNR